MHELGGRQTEFSRELLSQLAREIRHRREVSDAAPVDPLKELVRAKALMSPRREGFLEFRPLQIAEVGVGSCRGISHVRNHLPDFRSYCGKGDGGLFRTSPCP